MTTNASTNNSFNISGFVAVNAEVHEFDNSAVAKFPLSISRKEGDGDNATRKSALITCECWRKSVGATTFDLLKKGKLVQLSGFMKPEEWTSKDGKKQSRVVFVATSVSEPAAEDRPAPKKASKGKTAKKKEAA